MNLEGKKIKILVTGANGQLGKELVNLINYEAKLIGFERSDLDVTNFEQVSLLLNDVKPDIVIHTAAFTAVDLSEIEQKKAYQVNALGARNIAVISDEIRAKLCYISTDYVFDGESKTPYNEFHEPLPKTVYGKTKLAGEEFVRSLCERSFIVRTSWLYGIYGNNFVKTMLKLSKYKKTIQVVNDQIGSPTYTVDLCNIIMSLIETDLFGTYHVSNSGSCSWYEFAKAIFEFYGMNAIKVEPCTTDQILRAAPRPQYSVLDSMALRCNGFPVLRPWPLALEDFLSLNKTQLEQLTLI
jgi:dTDP-4-dehydrorhamnose reductase